MWVDASGAGDVSFGGGAASYYRGTVYAPASHCDIAGNNYSQALNTQFICYTVEVTGTGDVVLHYQEDDVFHVPPSLTVNE